MTTLLLQEKVPILTKIYNIQANNILLIINVIHTNKDISILGNIGSLSCNWSVKFSGIHNLNYFTYTNLTAPEGMAMYINYILAMLF